MMQHIDEHTLELYVLNSVAVESRRDEIQEHLKQCEGCRFLADQMTASYDSVGEQFKKLEARTSPSSEALERRMNKSVVPAQPGSPALPYRPVTRFQSIQYYFRQHPVIVGSGSFLALAGLALLANLAFKTPSPTDQNPAMSHNNPQSQEVEILNKSRQILWSIPTRGLRSEERIWARRTTVVDLNGDGINEVLTSVWMPGDPNEGASRPFRIFGRANKPLHDVYFTDPIRYLQRSYPNGLAPENIVAVNISNLKRKDIFVSWRCARSPVVIARYDAGAKELGQYWHFGALLGTSLVDLDDDGRKDLILTGSNETQDGLRDTHDSVRNEFPAIIVMDPSKIIGATKSVAAEGFHLPLSDAELYYLKLPTSSISKVALKREAVFYLLNQSDSLLTFIVSNDWESTESTVTFEYIFTRDMRVVQVKSDDTNPAKYEKLVKEGKLTGKLDQRYLDDLKNGVRYWDGEEWRKDAVKIRLRK